jgi:hypothetical protein
MKYILNSAVITAPGRYEYRLLDVASATSWLASGGWQSTIGYAETAAALSELTGIAIPVNRTMVRLEPGDEALVFRLNFPPGARRIDPSTKGELGRRFILQHAEIGMLTREA